MAQPQRKAITSRRIWAARGLALLADAIQLVLFPLFVGGAPEGADLILDVATAGVLSWICGFHLAFLPTAITEAVPVLDLFPTWTAAALYVTRSGGALAQRSEDQEIVDGAQARIAAAEAARQLPAKTAAK